LVCPFKFKQDVITELRDDREISGETIQKLERCKGSRVSRTPIFDVGWRNEQPHCLNFPKKEPGREGLADKPLRRVTNGEGDFLNVGYGFARKSAKCFVGIPATKKPKYLPETDPG
jgi:hypothetical protein